MQLPGDTEVVHERRPDDIRKRPHTVRRVPASSPDGPKYLNIVESRVSTIGIIIMVWVSFPHIGT